MPGYGLLTYTCEKCGISYKSDYQKPMGHNHVAEVTEPTCLEAGFTTNTCDRCGDSFVSDFVDALSHDWNDDTIIRNVICTGESLIEYHCNRCDERRFDNGVENGHYPGVPATCTQPQTCTECGTVLQQATGHNFQSEVTDATCLEIGFTTYMCENCGISYKNDYIKSYRHNYLPQVTEPTCLEKGFTTFTCNRCKDSYVTDYTDPLGYAWDKGTPITTSTCTGEGMTDYRCTRCDYHRLQAESAEGHTPSAKATCTNPQVCTECGAVLADALGHEYTTEVTAPTCLTMGFTTNTCERCGDTFKNCYTDAAGHTPSDWIVDQAATFDTTGSKQKECTMFGMTLEGSPIDKLYMIAITDTSSESMVKKYTIIVTDSDTKNPISGTAIAFGSDNKLTIRLPDNRLLDYADQTTVIFLPV